MLRSAVTPALLVAILCSSPAAAKETPEEFETRIRAELRAQAPEAESLFVEARHASDARLSAIAVDLYSRVCQMAPHYSHAKRRLGLEQLRLGRREESIASLRDAVRIQRSTDNLAALAYALASNDGDNRSPPAHTDEARKLASWVVAQEPENLVAEITLATIALQSRDLPMLRAAVRQLQATSPEEFETWYLTFLCRMAEGYHVDAGRALERCHELGLPDEDYAQMLGVLDQQQHPHKQLFHRVRIGGVILAIWLALMLLLLTAGLVLSRIALRQAAQLPASETGNPSRFDAFLRRTYAAVLWLCSAYFYVSVPIILALVVVLGGGVIYAFYAMGRIPLKLVALIGIAVVVTVWAVVRSLTVRFKDEDPGIRLDLQQHTRLREVLDRVAGRVGTRAVDNVYLTPGTEVAVMERGTMLRQFGGQRERCLILGAGVLEGFGLGEFQSVLAHEFGHFSNRDTAGGSFALAVRRSLLSMARNLVSGGVAAWHNPVWLFLNGFYRVFLRISQGASRLQEVLADRWAAFTYGSEFFVAGLTHVIRRSVEFDAHVGATLHEVTERQAPLVNLYSFHPQQYAPNKEEVAREVEKAMQAQASAYDSHPAPSQRIAWVRLLDAPAPSDVDNSLASAWDLFDDRATLESQLTALVRENVQRLMGVKLAEEAPTTSGAEA